MSYKDRKDAVIVGTNSFRTHKIISYSLKIALLVLAFICIFSLLAVPFSARQVQAADGDNESMAAAFVAPFSLPAGLVFNAPDRPLLYSHNADVPLEIPAVSRLMTLLISSDRLAPDDLIFISEEVEALAALETNATFLLERGMNLPYQYLIMRLLMQNSDAAALAITEHLFSNEANFLTVMQQRASELGMINTEFKAVLMSKAERENTAPAFYSDPELDWNNVVFQRDENQDLRPVIDGQTVPNIIPDFAEMDVFTAKSSLNDLSLLLQAIQASRSAMQYLQVSEQLVSVQAEDGTRVIPMRSNISRLFTLSEGKVDAAFHHRSDRFSLSISFGRTADDIPISTLLVSAKQSPLIDETLKLYDSIDQHYQRTPLTEEGEIVTGYSERTESGESFSLQYLDTIYYIHPTDDFYLKDDVIYVGNAPYLLPIQKGSMTGQIIFEMLDGTRIPARVGPDRDIISSNTFMARFVSLLYNNANLGRMIMGLAFFICIILAILLFREILHLLYWRRMLRLERGRLPYKRK